MLASLSAHAASLVIGDAPAPAAVDLTATGSTDWVHWGLTSASSIYRKAGVSAQIGSLTNVGGVIKRYNAPAGVRVDYNWSDGTPTASTTTTTGLYLAGVGNRFELSVPADTTPRTLTLYTGGYKARGQLDISLSDGSATPASVVIDNSTWTIDREVTVSFAAASGGQSLLISYTLLDDYGVGGNITVAGAALSVAGNLAPVAADDTASTSINDAVIITVLNNDSDADGTIDPTTVVVTLPASNGAAVANFDGTITYTPGAGYTGADSFSYTVQDNLGNTSNVATVTVTVINNILAFVQDSGPDGLISIETEGFDANTPQGSHEWQTVNAPIGFSGTGGMITTPNNDTNIDVEYEATIPRLDYSVNFVKTGTHYFWIRGIGPTGVDNSLHIGLDGAEYATSDRVTGFSSTGWSLSKATIDNADASINVLNPGLHAINIWMRENGFSIYKLVFTTNPA